MLSKAELLIKEEKSKQITVRNTMNPRGTINPRATLDPRKTAAELPGNCAMENAGTITEQ